MWKLRYVAIVLLLTNFSQVSLAAQATTATTDPADPMEKVLPEVKFDGVSLLDALDFLQDVSPGFSVVRKPSNDDAADSSRLTMHMKNVTVRQVLEAMQIEFPSVIIQPLGPGGTDASIYIVGSKAQPKPEQMILQVFRLGPAIQAMSERNAAKANDKPLDDILSLIQAALSQVPSQTPPTVQVHEATQTLIFKGNHEQLAAVQQAMAAVGPSDAEQAQDEQAALVQAHDYIERLRMQLAEEKAREQGQAATRSARDTNAQP